MCISHILSTWTSPLSHVGAWLTNPGTHDFQFIRQINLLKSPKKTFGEGEANPRRWVSKPHSNGPIRFLTQGFLLACGPILATHRFTVESHDVLQCSTKLFPKPVEKHPHNQRPLFITLQTGYGKDRVKIDKCISVQNSPCYKKNLKSPWHHIRSKKPPFILFFFLNYWQTN